LTRLIHYFTGQMPELKRTAATRNFRGVSHTFQGPMSAIGPKQTWRFAPHTSAFGGKADM